MNDNQWHVVHRDEYIGESYAMNIKTGCIVLTVAPAAGGLTSWATKVYVPDINWNDDEKEFVDL